jgi:hypothetical protein
MLRRHTGGHRSDGSSRGPTPSMRPVCSSSIPQPVGSVASMATMNGDAWGDVTPTRQVERTGVEVVFAWHRELPPLRFADCTREAEDLKAFVRSVATARLDSWSYVWRANTAVASSWPIDPPSTSDADRPGAGSARNKGWRLHSTTGSTIIGIDWTNLSTRRESGDPLARKSSKASSVTQLSGSGPEALEMAQAERAGARFEWHLGRITRMGNYELAGTKGVTIVWDEGGVTSMQGEITEEQWEIFKLAFMTTGRIAVVSDQEDDGWMYDYRLLEAVR